MNCNAAGIAAAVIGINGWPAGGVATATAITRQRLHPHLHRHPREHGRPDARASRRLQRLHAGYVGEVAKGRPRPRGSGVVSLTGERRSLSSPPPPSTRYPSARRSRSRAAPRIADGDPLTYMWEQDDRGGAQGTALVSNTKLNGPLFRQFGKAAIVSPSRHPALRVAAARTRPPRTRRACSPTWTRSSPTTRTRRPGSARRGASSAFSEFLPTAAYVGLRGRERQPAGPSLPADRARRTPGGGGVRQRADTLLPRRRQRAVPRHLAEHGGDLRGRLDSER